MEHILKNLEPANVWNYFEEICAIPHTSYHTEKISAYLVDFAQKEGLRYYSDESGNVIIYKDATSGYEDHDTVILQGHTDMVGAKTPDSNHDFENDPLQLMIDGDFVTAKDTTLGGDDGIAVAYMMAILTDHSIKHPALECVFTVNEEVGLLGAAALDMSKLSGKTLLNMDSEDEGIFTTGSAGGMHMDCIIPMQTTEPYETKTYTLTVSGLMGGHSGVEIGTGRPSAVVLLGRALYELDCFMNYGLVCMKAGEVDNAIAPKAVATLVLNDEDVEAAKKVLQELQENLTTEYRGIEEHIDITLTEDAAGCVKVLKPVSLQKVIFFLRNMPYGVMSRNAYNINLVETSLNPGVLRLDEEKFFLGFSIRSSIESAKHDLSDRLRYMTEFLGGEIDGDGDYPGWAYDPDSKVRPLIAEIYREMYGTDARFETIHAGLECGLFFKGLPGLDMISYGPDMRDIHTFDEKLSIPSVKRVYEMTIKILERL